MQSLFDVRDDRTADAGIIILDNRRVVFIVPIVAHYRVYGTVTCRSGTELYPRQVLKIVDVGASA